MKEKLKPIVIKDNEEGKIYVLDFSRKTAAQTAIDLEELEKKPLELAYVLFAGSFKKNQPDITDDEIDEIIDKIGGLTNEIIERLSMLYAECVTTLIANEDSLKNARMTVAL